MTGFSISEGIELISKRFQINHLLHRRFPEEMQRVSTYLEAILEFDLANVKASFAKFLSKTCIFVSS